MTKEDKTKYWQSLGPDKQRLVWLLMNILNCKKITIERDKSNKVDKSDTAPGNDR